MSFILIMFFNCSFIMQYYQRLFVLDLQIKYLEDKSTECLGDWLLRRWKACAAKKKIAVAGLKKAEQQSQYLRDQWALQVEAQTRPAPR